MIIGMWLNKSQVYFELIDLIDLGFQISFICLFIGVDVIVKKIFLKWINIFSFDGLLRVVF